MCRLEFIILMSLAQQVPQEIREQVQQVINLLLNNGLEYEANILQQPHPPEFLQPKSKYYRYYTQQLFLNGPNTRQHRPTPLKQPGESIKIEGTLETMSVGAMAEIIKNQLAENSREYYQPFENQYYQESTHLPPKNQNINIKIEDLIAKYAHLVKKKPKMTQKEKERKESRQEEARKETGTYHDGSLGAYGGKKYEGLGSRDQFDHFRREKSQSYYLNLQEKSK